MASFSCILSSCYIDKSVCGGRAQDRNGCCCGPRTAIAKPVDRAADGCASVGPTLRCISLYASARKCATMHRPGHGDVLPRGQWARQGRIPQGSTAPSAQRTAKRARPACSKRDALRREAGSTASRQSSRDMYHVPWSLELQPTVGWLDTAGCKWMGGQGRPWRHTPRATSVSDNCRVQRRHSSLLTASAGGHFNVLLFSFKPCNYRK